MYEESSQFLLSLELKTRTLAADTAKNGRRATGHGTPHLSPLAPSVPPESLGRLVAVGTLTALLTTTVAGCAANSNSPAATAAKGSGPVDVLYAGSLLDLMQQQISPAFEKAERLHRERLLRRVDGPGQRDQGRDPAR